jgi:hypothetical protein
LRARSPSLQEAQSHQQYRRPDAYGGVAGKQPDQERRHSHQEQREYDHRLAPDMVPEVPEDNAADRTGEEDYRERGEGR